jgi:hypothetical protein
MSTENDTRYFKKQNGDSLFFFKGAAPPRGRAQLLKKKKLFRAR